MKINHNIAAMMVNVNLNKTHRKQTDSLERLTSGYRITKAQDDAAGMAISSKMRSQIAGLERASRNSADGVSMIQTAEGAMNEVSNVLQRMRELAVQAANDTNMLEDRQAIQQEIDALRNEVDRLASETEFNSKRLLDGSCARLSTSTDPNIQMIDASDDVKAGKYEFTVVAEATKTEFLSTLGGGFSAVAPGQDGEIKINGESVKIEVGDTLEDVFSKLRELGTAIGVDVTPVDASKQETNINAATSILFQSQQYGTAGKIKIECENTFLSSALGINGGSEVKGKNAEVTLDSGFEATATVRCEGARAIVTDRSGFEMTINTEGASAGASSTLQVLNAGDVVLQVGANEGQEINLSIPSIKCEALNIGFLNVNTQENASNAISTLDAAIQRLSDVRGKLGAYQNRLDFAVNGLDSSSLNLTQSMSSIMDVDMAEEMSYYTQYDVLTQAATSMLSQANSRPQQILQLLQG